MENIRCGGTEGFISDECLNASCALSMKVNEKIEFNVFSSSGKFNNTRIIIKIININLIKNRRHTYFFLYKNKPFMTVR